MKLNDDYTPDVGDLVQYVGASSDVKNAGQIGVIVSRSRFATGYARNRRKSWLYAIQVPLRIMALETSTFQSYQKI